MIGEGQRRLWRFRISDLAKAMEPRMVQGRSTDGMGLKKPRSIRLVGRVKSFVSPSPIIVPTTICVNLYVNNLGNFGWESGCRVTEPIVGFDSTH